MGYEGGMNSAIWESGNASAVIVTAAYMAPDAPKLGRMSRVFLFAAVFPAADAVVAATALAHVSVFRAVFVEEASSATRRGYRNLALTIWDTKPEKSPANL